MPATATKPKKSKAAKKPSAFSLQPSSLLTAPALDRLARHAAENVTLAGLIRDPRTTPEESMGAFYAAWSDRLELSDPNGITIRGEDRGIVITTRQPSRNGTARRDVVAAVIPWPEAAAQITSRLIAPGETSTVTPAGIVRHDPDVEPMPVCRAAEREQIAPPPACRASLDVRLVPVASIVASPHQARAEFDATGIAELAESIRVNGLMQPITVEQIDRGKLQLIAGERRFRAVKLIGWSDISARVLPKLTAAESSALGLVENLQRADLSPIEEARGIAALIKDTKCTQAAAAGQLGRSQPYVANALRLLDLPEPFLGWVITREMSPSHARAVLPWLTKKKLAKSLASEWKASTESNGAPPSLETWSDLIRETVAPKVHHEATKSTESATKQKSPDRICPKCHRAL